MKKVLSIVGPTAIGKSSFGIKCAKIFDGEIISADAIQVYRGLDIGSAKIKKEEMDNVKHYLIDIKNADENYSVKEFQELGRNLIEFISKNNKLPIIVGGTGLYVKALLYDYKFFDEEYKDNQYDELSNEDIYKKIKKQDPEALNNIHINNRKRLVRALNIIEKHNIGISEIKSMQKHKPIYDIKVIGLTKDKEKLKKDIDKRVDMMFKDGLLQEVERLLKEGITFDNQSMQAIGYKELKDYFNNEMDLEKCIENIKTNTRKFSKRQYTWFNNQMDVDWFENLDEAIEDIRKWYE